MALLALELTSFEGIPWAIEPGGHFTTREVCWHYSRDRIVVSTSRCGRDNPGSNPGHGRGCEVSIRLSQPFFVKSTCFGQMVTKPVLCQAISSHDNHMIIQCLLSGWGLVLTTILKSNLPDGESNPGLPRDRRGYLPLYYRGWLV